MPSVHLLHRACYACCARCAAQVGGGDASRRAVASQTSISGRPHVPLVPVAGAAFSLSLLQQPNPDSVFRGRAFCTLPLPVTTALPFHLNGFFALPSNRRTIWEGTHGPDADAKTAWNRGLYDVLVPAFLGLLREAKRQWPVAQYLRLWPVASPEQTPQYFSKWITRSAVRRATEWFEARVSRPLNFSPCPFGCCSLRCQL